MSGNNPHKNYVKDGAEYKEKPKINFVLPPKKFEHRRTIYIELLEDSLYGRAIYNTVAGFSLFSMLMINLIEYKHHGRLSPAIDLIYEKFGKFDTVFVIWLGYNAFAFLSYYFFILWSKLRPKVVHKNMLDKFGILLLISYYGLSLFYTPQLINSLNIPLASSMIVLLESQRFTMKIHSFVRENAPKVLIHKSDKKNIKLPTFYTYLQFLYFPTLIYRDEYPRSKHTRWDFVFYRLIEILWCIACMAHLYTYLIFPIVKDTCKEPITILDFLIMLLKNAIPSWLCLLLLIFPMLHSSQNAVGEILKFGDRMFFSDWWTSLDMQQFFKKWNYLIGDWLYTYVNKDVGEIIFPGKTTLAKLITVLISALIHEWIYYSVSRIFCPIISFMMILGVFLALYVRVRTKSKYVYFINFMVFILGSSIITLFWTTEYFSRQNLPIKTNHVSVFWNHCLV